MRHKSCRTIRSAEIAKAAFSNRTKEIPQIMRACAHPSTSILPFSSPEGLPRTRIYFARFYINEAQILDLCRRESREKPCKKRKIQRGA